MSAARPGGLLPAALVVLGGVYGWQATTYGLGALDRPGSGLLPFAAGLGLVVTGAVLLARRPEAERALPEQAAGAVEQDLEPGARVGTTAALLVAAAICAFVVWQSRIIGLLPAASVAAAATSFLMRSGWRAALLTGLGFLVFAHLVFERWLEVPLPRGYLGQL